MTIDPQRCPGCGALDPMGDEDAWHSEGCPVVAATTSAQSPLSKMAWALTCTEAPHEPHSDEKWCCSRCNWGCKACEDRMAAIARGQRDGT